jgi:hypothetical protein
MHLSDSQKCWCLFGRQTASGRCSNELEDVAVETAATRVFVGLAWLDYMGFSGTFGSSGRRPVLKIGDIVVVLGDS